MDNYKKLALDAYNAGYAAAVENMSEDVYDTDDYASESTKLRRGATSILLGSLGEAIYNSIHTAKINKSVVASIGGLIRAGFSEADAKKHMKATIKTFKSKRFLYGDFDDNSDTIRFSDLTESGKDYIKGFYNKLDKIDEYSVEKAVKARRSTNFTASDVGKTIAMINIVCGIINIPFTYGISLIGTAIGAAFYSYYDKEESNTDDFENTSIKDVKESASIFDEDYFMM